MEKNKHKFLAFLIFLISFKGFGQSINRPEINLDEFIQKIAPIQTEDANYEDVYENLFTIYQNPLDLNKADIADLRALFFLTENQINAIMNHKKTFGNFLSIYELQAVEGLSMDDIRTLLPFVQVKNGLGSTRFSNFTKKAVEHYLVIRADQTLEPSAGFKEDKFAGSPQRYYTRYRMSHSKDFSIGFVSEKDAGERNFLDYYNFHVQVQNKGIVKNLVVGDYLMQFGQGMIFSAGFAAGKGSEPVYTTRRSNVGIRPYNSVVENGSFRGIANTIKNGNFEITTMAAHNKRDASVDLNEETQDDFFSSILSAGFHRTETEIANKNSISETNLGGNVLYKLDHLQVGFSVLHTSFDKTFQKRELLYNRYEFVGDKNTVLGPNISLSWQNFNFFGEAARSSSGGFGYITGLVGSLGPKVEWALNLRNYQPNFHTFYGISFAEGSRTINEKGIYNGLKYIIKKGLEVSAFYDSFSFPWLKYRVDAPSSGQDYQVRILYKPNKIFSQYIAFHKEIKQRNSSDNKNFTHQLLETDRNNLVLGTDYIYNTWLRLQSKLQYNGFAIENTSKSNGYAFIQDIETKIKRCQIKGRLAYFNTDSYDSRIYAYENDVLYAVSFPAYYGKGWRYYLIGKMPISRNLDAWIRIAQTNVSDRTTIGSGMSEIEDNRKTDLKVQLKYNF
ncbi:ComEA family DNA-binding protein [Lacihabitans soyangensis]|uniref:Helix-hairpin-helix domain-containing protein n=1 Tax=Lacihabitans soyangensis TaxID=869394 RepID=A0AAE3H3T1_9BACT|nr:helix-hairpin-helix domain-containing protein [Lacihabitans soyangensis]MCP9764368.1 helix-hairpin-helix domain-containing protein [Lacihabitans soyangensis]